MTSAPFMFVQLLAVSTTSCLASSEPILAPQSPEASKHSGGFFSDLILNEAVWGSYTEALFVLAIFAIAILLSVQRRRARNNSGPYKPKHILINEAPQKAFARKPESVREREAKRSQERFQSQARKRNQYQDTAEPSWQQRTSTAALEKTIHSTCQRLASGEIKGKQEKSKEQSEMDGLVHAVSRKGQALKLPELLDAALERSLAAAEQMDTPDSEGIASQLLLSALRSCAANRLFSEAVVAYEHFAARIGEGNASLWSILLYVVTEAGVFHHSKHILRKLCRQGSPSNHDFVNMVRSYAGQEDHAGLRESLEDVKSCGQSTDSHTFNRSLAACSGSSTPEIALKLAEELVAAGLSEMDNVGYNTLMKYNGRAGRISRCFELRAEMTARNIAPSEVTFGILLDACVSANELLRAREIFADLCASGLRLNVVHCTTFIKVLMSARLLDEAVNVLNEMIQSPGVKPDLITFSIIVKAYSERGDVLSALKLLEMMAKEGVKPDMIFFNTILSGCFTFPVKSSEVMHIFEMLLSHGMKPNDTTLSILLKSLALTTAWPTSLQALKNCPSFGLEPDARLYAQLAQACIKAHEAEPVPKVFVAMLENWKRQGKGTEKESIHRFLRNCVLGRAPELAAELRTVLQCSGIAIDVHMEKLFKSLAVYTERTPPAGSPPRKTSQKGVLPRPASNLPSQ